MATSREAYNRIVWDERLNASAFAIAYQDRMSGNVREKPLSEWTADGDIPWHRIRYIRCGEAIVWDRDAHLDLISTGQLPAAAFAPPSAAPAPAKKQEKLPEFEARSLYGYSPSGWVAIAPSPEPLKVGAMAIATFNVLCDIHEKELIQTEKRIPAIVQYLRDCNADILALQEATPPLLEALLAQDWTRDYFISEAPAATTLQPYGVLLLSRYPFTVVEHQFSAHKRVLVGMWQINGQLLRVAVVHLPSNRAHNAVEVRSRQLSALLEYLKTQPGDCLIVGDFNSGADEGEAELIQNGFIDIWQQLHPFEEGWTFDPQRNTLAALMSLKGESSRCDRLLLRAEAGHWVPRAVELFACEPIPDTEGTLYASDHFGVRAVLECPTPTTPAWETVRPIYRSAIVAIPPAEVWPTIQAIRRRHDRNIGRWMPHITLIYGFLPEDYFEEAAQLIAQALADVEPFELTLEGFDTFTHRSSSTAWLKPVAHPPGALHQLQAVLQKLFPQCDEQSKKSAAGFTPHLSVGQFRTPEEARSQLPSWHPISFPVDSVALISRRGDEPFEVRYRVALGGGSDRLSIPPTSDANALLLQLINHLEPELTQAQRQHRETILAVIAQACAECLGVEPSLHLLGSARLGVENPQSDLDIVCIIPARIAGEAFLEGVQQRLQGLCDRSRLVEDARVPVLRMQIEGVSVDLLCARTVSKLDEPLTEAARSRVDPASWQALAGYLEAEAILKAVQTRVSLESFRELLRGVRAWAKARQLHGNAWGFLGNFSWALLAAWSCASYPQKGASAAALLSHFFQTLAQHDWSQPVALTEAGKRYRVRVPPDWMPVITSVEPCQNSARNLTKSTAEILQRELQRAAGIIARIQRDEIGWEALFEASNLQKDSEFFLVLTAKSENREALENCGGWLEGHAIGLLIELERQVEARVRPWPGFIAEQHYCRAVLGIDISSEESREIIEQIAGEFVLQFKAGNSLSESIVWESVLWDKKGFNFDE